MNHPIDFHAVFDAAPTPCALLDTELSIIDVNRAFLHASGRSRSELIGAYLFDIFPEENSAAQDSGMQALRASLQRVLATGATDEIPLQRYPIPRRTEQGTAFEDRYWSAVNVPVFGQDGNIRCICHSTFDMTALHGRPGEAVAVEGAWTPGGDTAVRAQTIQQIKALGDELHWLHELFEQAPGFICYLQGPEHVYELANRAFHQLVGNRAVIGKPVRDALPDVAAQGFLELLDQVYRSGQSFVGRDMQLLVRKDDRVDQRYVDFVFQPVVDVSGATRGIFVQGHDITGQKRAENELRISSERWNFMQQDAGDAFLDWDLRSNDMMLSRRWREMLDLGDEPIADERVELERRLHPDDRARMAVKVRACLEGRTQGVSAEIRLRVRDGGWKPVLVRGKVVSRDDAGRPQRLTGTITDLSERKASEERLWREANFDALTGLPNRRLFRDRLNHEVTKSRRSGAPLALLFIDLDRFREANDLLGHDVGDALLKEASQRICGSVRASDTVARLGGDEFTVIVSDIGDGSCVQQIAQKIVDTLAKPFRLRDETIHLSASVGITLCPDDARDPEDLVRNADQAMYAAKSAGRNQFSYFTTAMQEAAQSRLRMIAELRNALPAGQFRLHFQPIVDLTTQRVVKAEALLRWQHPELGMLPPSDFIPLAEETGLINEIGNWVFMQAALWSQRWSSRFHTPFQVSVNKSPVQFHAESHALDWPKYLADLGISRNCISVEITEGVLLNASLSITDTLLQYRDAGIQVALDDFGTGYSSMAYLRKFDIDYLKIDRSFVKDMPHDAGSRTIAETIIVMAHKLGLKVIAEGIETEPQRDLLAAAGCDFGQGYLFSTPIAPEELEEILQREATAA
jgi:diguanylate cyclase (GGDEF)-like protein/PAS domain S-box-containing protein